MPPFWVKNPSIQWVVIQFLLRVAVQLKFIWECVLLMEMCATIKRKCPSMLTRGVIMLYNMWPALSRTHCALNHPLHAELVARPSVHMSLNRYQPPVMVYKQQELAAHSHSTLPSRLSGMAFFRDKTLQFSEWHSSFSNLENFIWT
jgi:hypothetical protein